jgi:serine phosphatase RsbU (regulator of sigma subunit)/ligand-binding sensor domain-containing protein
MRNFIKSIIFLLFIPSCLIAQETGKPFIRNYSPKEYNASTQNWSVTQDKRGLIYVGNNQGVLEYDGKEWRLIPVLNKSIVRSLSIDENGIIYVGAVGEFGYLVSDDKGKLHYESLSSRLNEEDKAFADVWQTLASKDYVYFGTQQILYQYEIKTGKINIYKTYENNFHVFFLVHDKLYVRQWNKGLLKYENNDLIPIREGELFNEERIYTMLPFDSNKILIGTRTKGFYIFSPEEEKEGKLGLFRRMPTEADDFITQNQLYNGTLVNHNTYAFATMRGGVVMIDNKGKLLNILNKESELQDDFILYAYTDKQKGLWLAMNSGISRIEISSSITFWNESSGLRGSVESVVRHQNTIYAATSLGVYYLNNDKFHPVDGIENQAWNLLEVQVNSDKKLLVATSAGVYEIKNNKANLLSSEGKASKLYHSRKYPSRVYVGLFDGLYYLNWNNGQWLSSERIGEVTDEVETIAEDEKGYLWLGTRYQGVALLKEDGLRYFEEKDGLPSSQGIRLFEVKGGIVFASVKGFLSFDDASGKFKPHPLNNKIFNKNDLPGTYQVADDVNGNIWLNFYDATTDRNWVEVAIKDESGVFIRDSVAFKRLPFMIVQALYPEKDKCWIGGSEGLFLYSSEQKPDLNIPYSALIRKVTVGGDSIVFAGANFQELLKGEDILRLASIQQPESLKPYLNFAENSVTFYFASPVFENELANSFSYYLEGYDTRWSSWTNNTKKEYTNLYEGTYKFRVKAKNVYDIESAEAVYEFTILPPWYRTLWAYFLYILLFTGVVYGSIQVSIRRLKQAKIKLEEIVKERTMEVTNQNVELLKQKEKIEYQKKEITDSINYAERIQKAILSPIKTIKTGLPDSFVLYKPKDIVSGDFYWFHHSTHPTSQVEGQGQRSLVSFEKEAGEETILFGAADCTGHGVPGAFMSMVGAEKLNYVVKTSTNPGEILQLLNRAVKSALRQSSDDESTRDGMDIALCRIDIKSKKLYFSGANRPLWIVRKESENWELTEYKATKSAIGGLTDMDQEFETTEIQLQKDDRIYIFSDGYADQFGGDKGKKMMTKRFKEVILSIQELSMDEQEKLLDENFVHWRSSLEQVDDVLVIGVKV